MTDIARVLGALADLAPGPSGPVLDVVRSEHHWVDGADVTMTGPRTMGSGWGVTRLAAIDALHRDERLLRLGAYFLWGTANGRKVRLPLASLPVRLSDVDRRGYRIVPAGDLELTPLITDDAVASAFEARLAAPDLDPAAWLRDAATTAGMPVDDVLTDQQWDVPKDRLVGVTTSALYVTRDVYAPSLRGTLRSWSGRPGLVDTALAAVYGLNPDEDQPDEVDPVRSPLPLNAAQREIVRRARTERVVVVSGPPGNGKSHAVVAAAIDAVDRGQSVLVTAQSTHAVEALGELLRRYPGPVPVLFGDAEKRDAIATELTAGLGRGHADGVVRDGERAAADAVARVEAFEHALTTGLAYEQRARRSTRWTALLPGLLVDAPAAGDPALPLAEAEDLLGRATDPATGWWSRWRRGRAERELRALLRARPGASLAALRTVLEAAGDVRAAADLATNGGTDLAALWDELHVADAEAARALGQAVDLRIQSSQRRKRPARRAVAALATALRNSRRGRREALTALDGPSLVKALPLWVGTVADVEDLLPPLPGLFDLVIVDEASHVDQGRAAPVLARAERALVIGDPRQLRFVSFVADVDVAGTLARHDLGPLADRLDVRRSSLFDVAAGATPVTWLDEHYRSVPHLIEFSARRFYGDRIAVATRHPRNEESDVIDVVRVEGAETAEDGVVAAEIDAVMAVLSELAASGASSIGVVTPFRAQADALEARFLKDFPLAEIDRLGLRVGTVHAYQGSEADHVIVSLGLADSAPAARRRFVADPNLFNVMTTRARRKLIVVTALTGTGKPGELIGDYLTYSEQPPAPPSAGDDPSGWTGALATELGRAGLEVRPGYPVGHWRVDLCVGSGPDAVALVCDLHPDGPAAHIERHRALHRAGWRVVEAFPTRWAGDAPRAAVELSSAGIAAAVRR